MARVLAMWRGMTVDERLQEFRWFDKDGCVEILPWVGKLEGELLHAQMEEETALCEVERNGWTYQYRIPKRMCCGCNDNLTPGQQQARGVRHTRRGQCQVCGNDLLFCCE